MVKYIYSITALLLFCYAPLVAQEDYLDWLGVSGQSANQQASALQTSMMNGGMEDFVRGGRSYSSGSGTYNYVSGGRSYSSGSVQHSISKTQYAQYRKRQRDIEHAQWLANKREREARARAEARRRAKIEEMKRKKRGLERQQKYLSYAKDVSGTLKKIMQFRATEGKNFVHNYYPPGYAPLESHYTPSNPEGSKPSVQEIVSDSKKDETASFFDGKYYKSSSNWDEYLHGKYYLFGQDVSQVAGGYYLDNIKKQEMETLSVGMQLLEDFKTMPSFYKQEIIDKYYDTREALDKAKPAWGFVKAVGQTAWGATKKTAEAVVKGKLAELPVVGTPMKVVNKYGDAAKDAGMIGGHEIKLIENICNQVPKIAASGNPNAAFGLVEQAKVQTDNFTFERAADKMNATGYLNLWRPNSKSDD